MVTLLKSNAQRPTLNIEFRKVEYVGCLTLGVRRFDPIKSRIKFQHGGLKMRQPGPGMNPSHGSHSCNKLLILEKLSSGKYLWFNENHGEWSFITKVFRNLAWIVIRAVVLVPPEPPTLCVHGRT